MPNYDAILLVSFGGPEGPDDVMPFLENVTRGRGIPQERLEEVVQHYLRFDGVSPINEQCRVLLTALITELNQHGPNIPVYWGNRNWHPMLADTLQQMADDGITNALAFMTSAYSSYSSCRQYLEDVSRAQEKVGPSAPQVDKLRLFYNHPGFIEPMIESVTNALEQIPEPRRSATQIIFTAHSLPTSMTNSCDYVKQLEEACRLVGEGVGHDTWQLAYQSRSGSPSQPWLEPDICDALQGMSDNGELQDVAVVPIGFTSDHMEVLFDLDEEASELAKQLDINMVRAATVGAHPRFVTMIRELIQERLDETPQRQCLGQYGPSHDVCPADCCPAPKRRPAQS